MHYDKERASLHRPDYPLSTEHKSNTSVNIRDLWQTPKEIFNKLFDEFLFISDVAVSITFICVPSSVHERFFLKPVGFNASAFPVPLPVVISAA